jgi:DNA-binding NtrC family response regulator
VAPFGDQVIAEFEARTWAGNVRELKNAVLAFAAVGALPPAMSPRSIDLDGALRAAIDLGTPYAQQKEQLAARFQRIYLDMLMTYTNSNQSEAARISGLDRTYLNKVLRKLS